MKSNGVDPIYGDLPQEWQMVSLGFLIDSNKAELATGPFGTMLQASEYRPTGTPVVAVQHIGENRLKHVDLPRVDEETAERLQRYKLKIGDIVFGRKGSVERRAIIRKEEEGWLEGSDCIRLRFLDEEISPEFVSYVLGSVAFKDWIMRHAGGATMPSLNQSILKLLPLPLPPLPEQRAIARILGALDDKIELNRRMNHTLEEMARALFKSWFVDFDPVTAKAEGRVPFGMNAETTSLFPAEFEETGEGVIPKGWKFGTIGDIADVIDCLHAKKPEQQEVGKIFLQLNNIRNDGLLDLSEVFRISDEDYAKWISRIEASEGDCVITNVGRVGAVSQIPPGVHAALGRNMTAIRLKQEFPYPAFMITCLLSDMMKDEINSKMDAGTILNALNVKNIPLLRLYIAPHAILSAFEKTLRPLRRKMEINLLNSQTLSFTRDSLLPKLMSGELRVKQAEKIIQTM